VLYTSTVTNQLFEVAWRKLETTLKGQGMTNGAGYDLIDGADPESKALRTALWEVSKTRSYPQVFLKNEFVGDMDGIQELLDSGKFATVFEGFANACTPR